MHIDARKIENNTTIEGDICIIGAGAAGIAIAKQFITLGIGNIIMVDIKGIICDGDEFDNPSHYEIAKVTNKNKIKGGLAEAMKNEGANRSRLQGIPFTSFQLRSRTRLDDEASKA